MLGHAVAELRAAGAGLPLRTRRETQGRDRCQIVWQTPLLAGFPRLYGEADFPTRRVRRA